MFHASWRGRIPLGAAVAACILAAMAEAHEHHANFAAGEFVTEDPIVCPSLVAHLGGG